MEKDEDQMQQQSVVCNEVTNRHRLEKLISNNIQIESSNQRLLLKQQQNLSIKTPNSSSSSSASSTSSSSSSSSSCSAASTMSSASSSYASSVLSAKSILNSLTSNELVPQRHHQVTNAPTAVAAVKKWTCMICLSKHALAVKVCSICGSLQQNESINVARPTLNSPKINTG